MGFNRRGDLFEILKDCVDKYSFPICGSDQGWKNTHIVREHVREHVLVLEQEQNKNMKNFWYREQEQNENRKDSSQEHCS